MSPEDRNTYWRTCGLTPLQIQNLEDFLGRILGPYEPPPDVQACLDSMELQMMGIKP